MHWRGGVGSKREGTREQKEREKEKDIVHYSFVYATIALLLYVFLQF